jgi:hypothetical protein
MHWNTMEYIINTSKCTEKHSNIMVSFKIHIYTIKNTFLYFNIYYNTFQIHCNTFITYLWYTLGYHYYTSICFHIHWNCLETSQSWTFLSCHYNIFQNCHGASLFYQNVVALAMTCLLQSKNEAYSMKPINLIG